MNQSNFDGAIFAHISTCHYDSSPCPYNEGDVDDLLCLDCLQGRIAEYRRYVKKLEAKISGPVA